MDSNEDADSQVETGVLAAGPSLVDGSPIRCPVAVHAHGGSVAVWSIDLLGAPCGAWVWPYQGVDTARRLLALIDRRGVVTIDAEDAVRLLQGWSTDAGMTVPGSSLSARICDLGTLVSETSTARQSYADALGGSEAPLVWAVDVPDAAPVTIDEYMRCSGVGVPPGPAESRDALLLARVTKWAIELWRDTEAVRLRRANLRKQFGSAHPLPPSWHTATREAYESPFPI